MRKGWMLGVMSIGMLLGGCASDGLGDSVASHRPECLVGDDPLTASRDSGMSARDRNCGTDRSLKWSTEQQGKDSMKVDFGKKND
jgi:hypothetical protein